MTARRSLNRLHVWLGWLVGVPLLIWTISGLWMVARPIDEVRGTYLKAAPLTLAVDTPLVVPTFPADHGPPSMVRLEQQTSGPVWVATFARGHEMRASARDGRWMPKVSEAEARAIADRWHKPAARIVSARHTPASAPPLDLRRERPAWGVAFADGGRVYVDADTGSLLAVRSEQWRWFDLMWGLHIMDLQTREDTSHPLLIGLAALAALATLFGLALLPMARTLRRRKRGEAAV